MVTATDRLRIWDAIDGRLEFETMLADSSSRFINLPPGTSIRRSRPLSAGCASPWAGPGGPVAMADGGAGHRATRAYPSLTTLSLPNPTETDYPWTVQQLLAGRAMTLPSLDFAIEHGLVEF
jgi:hypothetical protein